MMTIRLAAQEISLQFPESLIAKRGTANRSPSLFYD
jgi:hypothetical protein